MEEIATNKNGEAYLFHMNWTLNNSEKRKYLKDLHWWFLNDICTAQTENLHPGQIKRKWKEHTSNSQSDTKEEQLLFERGEIELSLHTCCTIP